MSINNLTYDNLKAELSKMEQRLEEYEKIHAEKVWEWGCAEGVGIGKFGNVDVLKVWEWGYMCFMLQDEKLRELKEQEQSTEDPAAE